MTFWIWGVYSTAMLWLWHFLKIVGYFVNKCNFHWIESTFCRWVVPLMAKGSYLDTSLKISDDDRFWAVAPFHSTPMLVPVPTASNDPKSRFSFAASRSVLFDWKLDQLWSRYIRMLSMSGDSWLILFSFWISVNIELKWMRKRVPGQENTSFTANWFVLILWLPSRSW